MKTRRAGEALCPNALPPATFMPDASPATV